MSTRILIVDDEPVLAFSLAATLEQAGFEVVGPAASVAQSLALIEGEGCDAAILDFVLRDGNAAPVAAALRSLGKPFVVLSGEAKGLGEEFAGVPVLAKPVRAGVLLAELRRCCPASRGEPSGDAGSGG